MSFRTPNVLYTFRGRMGSRYIAAVGHIQASLVVSLLKPIVGMLLYVAFFNLIQDAKLLIAETLGPAEAT